MNKAAPSTRPPKQWFAELLAKQSNPNATCTVRDWGYCDHAEYGRCRHHEKEIQITGLKAIVSGLMLLFSYAAIAQGQQIGYLVTIARTDTTNTHIYKFDNCYDVDTLVILNFGDVFTNFSSEAMLANNYHFQIITNNIEFYCEKKRIVGAHSNGALILRNLKRE